MRVTRTKHGALLYEGRTVLSTIRTRPGPLHDLYDVMALAAMLLSRGPRIALLGFGGGGILAPLRAAGWTHPVEAVDRTDAGEPIFRDLAGGWCGRVKVHQGEAGAWLRGSRRTWDLFVEDLTVNGPGGVTKPPESLAALPRLMRERLHPEGAVVVNALPVPGWSWPRLQARLTRPFHDARLVLFPDYMNRLVLTGYRLPEAPSLSRLLRTGLRGIGSRMATRFSVRHLPPGPA